MQSFTADMYMFETARMFHSECAINDSSSPRTEAENKNNQSISNTTGKLSHKDRKK